MKILVTLEITGIPEDCQPKNVAANVLDHMIDHVHGLAEQEGEGLEVVMLGWEEI